MYAYSDIKNNFGIQFPDKRERIVFLDIFNNDYTKDVVKKNNFMYFVYGLKKLYVDGDVSEFMEIMDECIENKNNHGYVGYIYYYQLSGEYIKALEYCKLLEKEEFCLGVVFNAVGNIYRKMREPFTENIIFDYYKKAIKHGLDSAKENMAQMLASNRQYKEAIPFLLDVKEKDDLTYYKIGLYNYNLGNLDKFLEYRELAKDYGYVLLSLDYYRKKHYDFALELLLKTYTEANITDDTRRTILEIVSNLCFETKKYKKLIEVLESIEEKDNKLIKYLSHAYMSIKEFGKAYKYLYEAKKGGDAEAAEAIFRIMNLSAAPGVKLTFNDDFEKGVEDTDDELEDGEVVDDELEDGEVVDDELEDGEVVDDELEDGEIVEDGENDNEN